MASTNLPSGGNLDNSDSDASLEHPPRKKKKKGTGKQLYTSKGAMLGLVGDLFRDFTQAIHHGLAQNLHTPRSAMSASEAKRLEFYRWIVASLPQIPDEIATKGPEYVEEIGYLLDRGRTSLRGTTLDGVKKSIGEWYAFVPALNSDKALRGFNHPVCGRLLCPAQFDYGDMEVARGLRHGSSRYPVSPLHPPNFLWRDEKAPPDPKDHWIGYARGQLLLKAMRHILYGPQAATTAGQKIGSRKPRAQSFKIRSITPAAIAYAAVMVHFALSSQDTFNAIGHMNRFNYTQFYQSIVHFIEHTLLDDERADLLGWWNQYVHYLRASSSRPKPIC
ncbi:hypothetical protein C8Q77DRAFT_1112247 [Trametes polyzona]|nr:hypothetical protein C8Q77DRAFT_1112247 [Trametes polyzona]